MKAQTWLDQNYPQGGWINYCGEKEQRRWVGEIYINEQLEGELDLADFANRQFKVLISHYVDETKFEIKNLTGIKLINAQEYIDQEYPTKESRTKETKLYLLNKNLEGDLNIVDFTNLKELNCWKNKLTSLRISNCHQLEKIECSYNQITKLEINNFRQLRELRCNVNKLTSLIIKGCDGLKVLTCSGNQLTDINSLLVGCQPQQLRELHLENNNFTGDLSPFSKFINLERLWININPFAGSLAPLQDLTKLWQLSISDTDIDSGLEWLTESVRWLSCSNYKTKEREVKKLDEQLTPHGDNYNKERIKDWREANHDLIIIVKKIKETEQMLNNLNKALLNQKLEELTDKALQVFIFESESEITELQKQLNLAREKQLTQIEIPIKGNN